MQLKTSPLHGVLHGTPLRYIFWGLDFYTGSDPKNMTTIVAIRTPNEDKKLPKIVPIEKSQKSTFFVLVTGVFWHQRFVCGGQRYENAKSFYQNDEIEGDEKSLINVRGRWELAPAFTATAQLSPGPKFSEDNNDATNDAGIQKHLWQIGEQETQKDPQGYYQATQNE